MGKKIALLYGADGIDSDVARNLRFIYTQLGYRVLISKKLIVAEVICIMRPPNYKLDLSKFRYIHVFDYSCIGNDLFFASLEPRPGLRIFCASISSLESRLKFSPLLKPHCEVLLPPVAVDYWIPKVYRLENDSIHIGNFKNSYSDSSDKESTEFVDFIVSNKTIVWGVGWKSVLKSSQRKGRLPLLKTSKVYSKSRVGLGMMYPFQRGNTISGRFWQGPLSGCPILVEKNYLDFEIPGVYEVDYGNLNLTELLNHLPCRAWIRDEARKFWTAHYAICYSRLEQELQIKSGNYEFMGNQYGGSVFHYFSLNLWNKFRDVKYKFRLDRF